MEEAKKISISKGKRIPKNASILLATLKLDTAEKLREANVGHLIPYNKRFLIVASNTIHPSAV